MVVVGADVLVVQGCINDVVYALDLDAAARIRRTMVVRGEEVRLTFVLDADGRQRLTRRAVLLQYLRP